MTTDILNGPSQKSQWRGHPSDAQCQGDGPASSMSTPPLTWLWGVRRRHLVVHQRVGRGLLMGHHAGVPGCAQRCQPRSRVLVRLRRVLPVLLLLHLLAGAQLRVLQLLHVEVLAFRKQLLPLLF